MNKIVIDLGGTNTRIATIDKKLNVVKVFETEKDFNTQIEMIVNTIKDIEFDAISISSVGPFKKDGTYFDLPNLPTYNGFNIITTLEDKFDNITVKIQNDANCSAVGEYYERQDADSLLYVTISTGFGAGFVSEGNLIAGYTNNALDVHRLTYNNEPIENYCSGTGIFAKAKEMDASITSTKDVFTKYNKDDKMTKVIDTAISATSETLIDICRILNPKYLIIGGSVATKNEFYFDKIRQNILDELYYDILIEYPIELEYSTLKGANKL